MTDIFRLLWCGLIGLLRSRASLEAEIMVLRHQLNVLRRRSPKRLTFSGIDRLAFASLFHCSPQALKALRIVQPETITRWHRAGFRSYWRRKLRPRGGRPQIPAEIRQIIREMSLANPILSENSIRHGLALRGRIVAS